MIYPFSSYNYSLTHTLTHSSPPHFHSTACTYDILYFYTLLDFLGQIFCWCKLMLLHWNSQSCTNLHQQRIWPSSFSLSFDTFTWTILHRYTSQQILPFLLSYTLPNFYSHTPDNHHTLPLTHYSNPPNSVTHWMKARCLLFSFLGLGRGLLQQSWQRLSLQWEGVRQLSRGVLEQYSVTQRWEGKRLGPKKD